MKKDESIVPESFLIDTGNNKKGVRIFDKNCTYTILKNKRTLQMSPFLNITIKEGGSNGM